MAPPPELPPGPSSGLTSRNFHVTSAAARALLSAEAIGKQGENATVTDALVTYAQLLEAIAAGVRFILVETPVGRAQLRLTTDKSAAAP